MMEFSEHNCNRSRSRDDNSNNNNNNNDNNSVQTLNIDGTLLDSSAVAAVFRDAGNCNNCHHQQQPKIREITLRNVSVDAIVLQGANELLLSRHNPINRTTNSSSCSSSSSNDKSDYYWMTTTTTTNIIDIIHCSGLVSELIRIVLPYTEKFRFTGNIPIAHNLDTESLNVIGKNLGGNDTNNINDATSCPNQTATAGNGDNNNEGNNNMNSTSIKLKTLILKGSRLESLGFLPFCEGLGVNTTLEHLQLSNCTLEDDGVLLLASALQKNKRLESLFLANCKFGSKTRLSLSLSLQQFDLLHDHDVVGTTQSINNTNPQIHLPIVLEAMVRHPNLQKLKIYDMFCNKQSIRAIGEMLGSPGSKLRHLGLKNNLSHPDSKLVGVDHYLFQALSHNTCLTYLKLSGNNLNDDDMVGLSRILTESKTTSIKTLSITDNLIVSHGLLQLASRLTDANSLRCLDVQRNPITDQSKKAMISALKNNVQLERLDLDGSWDTEKFWWLSLNRGGRRALQTTGNNKSVPSSLWPTILERAYNLQFGRNQNQNQSSPCTTNVEIVYYMIRRIPSLFDKSVGVPKQKRQRTRVVKTNGMETKPKAKRKFNV